METVCNSPIPCTVDGKPAEIVGYGDGNAGPVIDYRLIGEKGLKWVYVGSRRLVVNEE